MSELTLEEVVELHTLISEADGTTPGIKDEGMVLSALAQPSMAAFGQELYPTVAAKAAALCYSLAMNHGFHDGNKRIAHAATERFLLMHGYELSGTVDEQAEIILSVAAGQSNREELTEWICGHMVAAE